MPSPAWPWLLPIAYCILDAAGTFADSRVLDKLSARALAEGMLATADECSDYAASAANCAYELTFLLAGIVCFVYVVLIRKQKLIARHGGPQVRRRSVRDGGPVRLHLRPRPTRPMWPFPPPSSPPTAWRRWCGAAFS